jgi:hypothetical protein
VTAALTSRRLEVDLDSRQFNEALDDLGWGDGLPCVAPTEELVAEYVDASGRRANEVIAVLPPRWADCTVEKVAINAALTLAPPAAMPLLIAAIEALADDDFGLAGVNATTASVSPAMIVNGPTASELRLPAGHSCFGGMRGPAPSIGRALRLVLRHVAGQEAGVTSESVFGQPARVVGLVFREAEDRSPWAPLAERRGVAGDAVTTYAAMGTTNVVDTIAESAAELLQVMGRSAGFMGSNGFLAATAFSEFAVAFNPVWAEIIGAQHPDVQEVQRILWEHAALPIDAFPEVIRPGIEERIQSDGLVHVVHSPDDVLVMVCGGEGSLHGALLPGFSHSLAVTRSIAHPENRS